MRIIALAICIVAWALPAWAGSTGSGSRSINAPKAYNVLMIWWDDVGQYQLPDVYQTGNDRDDDYVATPNLAALAAAGVTLNNFWTTPRCGPGRAMAMTARYGARTGVFGFGGTNLRTAELTIPKALDYAFPGKYEKAWFGKGGMSDDSITGDDYYKVSGVYGFELFMGNYGAAVGDYISWDEITVTATSTALGDITPDPTTPETDTTYLTDYTTDSCEAWWAGLADPNAPWFAWVSYNSPHTPVHDPADARTPIEGGGSECNLGTQELCYQAMIEDVDAELGELLTTIAADIPDTLIIVCGDNGAAAGFGGGGKGTTKETGINVGCVIGGGAVAAGGRESDDLFSMADLLPTALAAAGRTGNVPRSHPYDPTNTEYAGQERIQDGISMWPMIRNDSAGSWGHEFVISQNSALVFMARWSTNDYKLTRTYDSEGAVVSDVLHLLPTETGNLNDGDMTAPEQTALTALQGEIVRVVASVNEDRS